MTLSTIPDYPVTGRQVLPTTVRPSHYSLILKPEIEKSVFDGDVDIKLTFKKKTDKIVLNSNELDIYNVTLKLGNSKTVYLQQEDVTYDTKLTQATIALPNLIPLGTKGKLNMKFRGKLNDDMKGFYRSSYKGEDGDKKYLATTQFEPSLARKAFPCWDEPSIKATFDISLKVPRSSTALSNMDVIKERRIDNELKLVKFRKTPVMSTYLLAFVIGEFDYIEDYTSNKIKCRVYTPKGLSQQGKYALGITTKVLDLYDNLFHIRYPLPKMDLVAIQDFEKGAMENWGLVTYRVTQLLLDDSGSTKTKQSIAETVAHEMAHQWFGNLVTMEWWSDLWLNEGFATWVASYAITKLFPEWDFWTNFVVDKTQSALELDSLTNSHPVEVEVDSADEVDQIFDNISYNKGGSVIHMLYNYLGEETFFKGIRYYLKRHSYRNANTINLWQAISSVSNQDVGKFMSLWTKQTGYPYLEVVEKGNKLILNQKRFLKNGNIKSDQDDQLWWIPLGFISGNSSKELILTERSMTIDRTDSFYKFNKDSLGPYRVHYPKNAIEQMGPLISDQNLFTTRDRIRVVSDAAALSQSGIGNATGFLDALELFKGENNYYVLNSISSNLNTMQSVWFEEPKSIQNKLKKIQRNLFSPLVKKLGWEFESNESVTNNLLRTLAITSAGYNGDVKVIKEAQSRFQSYTGGDKSAIHPDLLTPILKIVAMSANSKTYNLMKQQYLATNSAALQRAYLNALGSVQSPRLIVQSLKFAISSQVPRQDAVYMFQSLGENPTSRRAVWKFLQLQWPYMETNYPPFVGTMLGLTAGKLSSPKDTATITNFFKSKETTKFKRELDKTKDLVGANSAWLSRARKEVRTWLQSHHL